MAFTYSGDPSNSTRDELRFLIQDTDQTDFAFQDGELDYFLLGSGDNPFSAAIRAIETLIAKYSKLVDEKVGQVSKSYSQLVDHYKALLATLQRRVAIDDALPFAGGISESQKDVQEDDHDRVDPFFTRDMHDYVRPENERLGRAVNEGVQDEEDV